NPTGIAADLFGFSLATSSNAILVGAMNNSTAESSGGAVYLYDANGNLLHTFLNPNSSGPHEFGWSVAFLGKNVLVGAADVNFGGVGAAYLFDGDPASPTFGQLLQTFTDPTG